MAVLIGCNPSGNATLPTIGGSAPRLLFYERRINNDLAGW
jgi:hypothetical protein